MGEHSRDFSSTVTTSRMVKVDNNSENMFQIFKSAKKGGCKFYGLFLLTEWLERNFCSISIILLLDFSEIMNIFLNYSVFYISAHLRM